MANSYNTQVLRDGFRNYVVRVTGEIDLSAPSDIPPTALMNITTLNPPCKSLRVDRVKFSLPPGTPLDINLWWQATTNELFWGMGGGDDNEFSNFGGLTNNAAPGATGNILFSTTGATGATVQAGNFWTFAAIIECVKLQPAYPL